MSQVFSIDPNRKQQVLVEYITSTGSGFAITPQGEQVFMNKRLVDTMGVEPGDIYDAFLLPNYPDKRESIPWRALRVEKVDSKIDLMHATGNKVLEAIQDYMATYDDDGLFTAEELSDALEIHIDQVREALTENAQDFARVDAYYLNSAPS